MLVPRGTLVMVADGAFRALYRNEGEAAEPRLVPVDDAHHHAARTADLGTDRQGRRFESTSATRGGYEGPDYHQQEEDRFAIDAAAVLNAHAAAGSARLILVAAPHVLGVMRQHLDAAAQAALIAELPKDYAQRPAGDIADLLAKYEA